MAKKKASGSTSQQPTRPGKRLGVKLFGGQKVKVGQIIVRQRGSRFHPGAGVKMGRDFTLYAIRSGEINFRKQHNKNLVEVIV